MILFFVRKIENLINEFGMIQTKQIQIEKKWSHNNNYDSQMDSKDIEIIYNNNSNNNSSINYNSNNLVQKNLFKHLLK